MPNKNQIYIAIIALLVAIKFVVVPVFEWQSAQIQDIKLLQRQYAKYTSVVDIEDEVIAAENKVKQQVDNLNELLPNVEDEGMLLLTNQQKLEAILEKHNLKINNFGWQAPIYLNEQQYTFYPADVRLTGKVLDLMTAVLELEKDSQTLFLKDLQLTLTSNTDSPLGEFFGVLSIQSLAKRSAP